jgi:hypothetical protein
MLRLQENGGWRLVTHPDHAALAGQFAECWGNSTFVSPEPRADVLLGVSRHDDGWRGRDAAPQITRAGLPSAFSRELVGKYSAFEEIDLEDYLAVRRRAVAEMAVVNRYAAILISMHTYDLLTARADRSTIAPGDLTKLDGFLAEQRELQNTLRAQIDAAGDLPPEERSHEALLNHFRLLQACDNLSLLSCVDYPGEASLLHPLPVHGGGAERVRVERVETRTFRLTPSPFPEPEIEFKVPARFVAGERFSSSEELGEKFAAAPVELLPVRILA